MECLSEWNAHNGYAAEREKPNFVAKVWFITTHFFFFFCSTFIIYLVRRVFNICGINENGMFAPLKIHSEILVAQPK